MTILTFPTIRRPAEVSWRLQAVTQFHQSPFDGSQQTLALPAARWAATITWPSLPEADRRTLEAFLFSLGGRAGRFYYAPPHGPRRATGTGTILLLGAGQTGPAINVDGFSASAQAFRVGDWMSYTDTAGRRRLHQVTADTNADGSGGCTVPIAPPIRRPGPDNGPVEIANPSGVFMLAQDETGLTTRAPLLGSLTLDIVEALA